MTRLILLVAGLVTAGVGAMSVGATATTQAKAPAACVNAIGDARQVSAVFANTVQTTENAFRAVAPYPDMVKQAALAGANNDLAAIHRIVARINAIDGRLSVLTRQIKAESNQVSLWGGRFNRNAATCK